MKSAQRLKQRAIVVSAPVSDDDDDGKGKTPRGGKSSGKKTPGGTGRKSGRA